MSYTELPASRFPGGDGGGGGRVLPIIAYKGRLYPKTLGVLNVAQKGRSFSVKIVDNRETDWTSAEEHRLIKLCRLPPGLRHTDWVFPSATHLLSAIFNFLYFELFFCSPNSSKWRDSTVPIYFCVSWFFLDETKNLSYCGPKDFSSCVIPVDGKLLRTHTCFSDLCSL